MHRLNYLSLLQANNSIQSIGDDTYWLCVTRTVQESKLFPVPAYMLLSYLCCYYRYPALLRKIESRLSAQEIGDRARAMGGKFGNLPGWALPTFFLLGREMLGHLDEDEDWPMPEIERVGDAADEDQGRQ